MKVMGSSVLAFEIIVLGLVMPVAYAVYDYPLLTVVWVTSGLSALCIFAIGGMRRGRNTAVITGTVVQILVIVAGLFIKPFLVPGILFGITWVLAIVLSGKVDAAKLARAKSQDNLNQDKSS